MKKKAVESRNLKSCAASLHAAFHLLMTCGLSLWLIFISTEVMAQNALPNTIAQRVIACMVCHGKEGRAASDGFYPRIAGKPAGYLYNQLVNFREGRRKYPLMIYLVDHLSDPYLKEMAEYFSGLHPPYPAPQPTNVPETILERGRNGVQNGDATRNVPACVACHGKTLTGVAPSIPGLIGLPRDYLGAQFGSWKNGTRRAAAPDCMGQIFSRLTAEEVTSALDWLAAQPIPPQTAAARTATEMLPMSCGSFPQ